MADKVNINKDGVTAELYTKSAVDGLLGKKADTDNPNFEGQLRGYTLGLPSNIEAQAPYLGSFENALAFLFKRGGSCVIRDATDGTLISNNEAALSGLFDGRVNQISLPISAGQQIQIIIKCPENFYWGTNIFIDLAHPWLSLKNIKLEAGFSETFAGTAENPDSDINWAFSKEWEGLTGASIVGCKYNVQSIKADNKLNYIRLTITEWSDPSVDCRLGQIAVQNFQYGIQSTLLSRGGDTMYGNIDFIDSAGINIKKGSISFEGGSPLKRILFNGGDTAYIGCPSGDGGVWGSSGEGRDNLRLASWHSIGFHDNCHGHDYISMNVRDGIIRAKKLQDADTGKQTSIGDIATATGLEEVRKIAEGKTATYAVNAQKVDSTKYCNNKLNIAKSVLDTNSVKIDKQGVTKLLDINNKEIDLTTLQVGDIVFTAEQTIKDWWFAGTTAAYFVFYGFDADTPDLSGYVKNTELANYTPLTDFNNLKDSLGTASKCDFSESISDSIVDTGTGTLKKKELPTSGAIKTYLNTYFMRKTSLGDAASHGVDTSIGLLQAVSNNLPTSGAVVAYVTEKTKLKTINGNTISGEGNLALPTASKKVQFTRGNSASGSYLLLGKFKTTSDAGNGGAVHIHGYLGEWDGVDAKTLVDVIISNRGGLSIKGTVKGKASTKYDLFCTKDSSDNYYVYIKAQTFTIGQLLVDYDDWDEFGGFLWLCDDTWTNGYAGSSNVSCISKLLPHDTYYGSFDASSGEVDVKAVTGGPSGSIVTIFGMAYSNGSTVSIQRQTSFYTDYDCVAINEGYQQSAMISATGFVPPGQTYHCFANTVLRVYVHVFDL